MDDRIIDRVFQELDINSNRLIDLSRLVHTNAGILGVVTKLVVGIILFLLVTSIGALYGYMKKDPSAVLYHREDAPIEHKIKYPPEK